MSSTCTSNKKAKKNNNNSSNNNNNTKDEIKALKQYIAKCPNSLVPPTSIAIQTCINALNNELKKMERDEKLLLKFAQEKVENMNMSMNMSASNSMSNSISMSMCSMNSSNVSISNFDAVNVDVVDVDTDDGVCVQMSATTGELGKAKGSINSNNNSNTTNKGDNNHMEEDVDAHLREWQDVSPEENQIKSASLLSSATSSAATAAALREKNLYDEPSPSALGIALAKCAISDMSSANIQVSTPVAALALALHSALRSDFLGFKCTGVPEEEDCFSSDLKISATTKTTTTTATKKKSNGFAPPVRELPKGEFLPDNWDNCASLSNLNQLTSSSTSRVTLRYRKNGLGATILRVTQMVLDGDAPMNATTSTNTSPNTTNNQFMARISFGPAGGEPQILDIPMNRHVNVDGLNAALSKLDKGKFKVKPALHYKSLSLLLSDFCKCSDLGSVKEIEDSSYKSTSASSSTHSGNSNSNNNHTDVMINVNDVNLTQTSSSNPRSRITTSYNIIPGTSTSTSTKNNNMNVNVNVNVNNIDYYQNQNRIRNGYRVSASPNIQDDLLAGGVSTNRPGGDFANDLLPSGVPSPGFADPRYGVGGPSTTGSGNLMGMNHPVFQRNNDDYNPNPGGVGNFPGVGGLGMQPRFDPYHPPGVGGGRFGVGGGRGNGRGRGRGGRGRGRGSTDYSGDPNPDHERPPNTFGNNDMFM